MKKYIIITLLFSVGFIAAQTTVGEYNIKNIDINTEYADFGTAFFGTDAVVFSAPKNKRSLIKNIWKPNSQAYLDLYMGTIGNEGEIVNKQKVKGTINSRFHEAVVAFTKDVKTVYFTGNNFYNNIVKNDSTGTLKLQLFKASIDVNGGWSNIEKLPFNSDHYSTGHPALSVDNKKLYFVSDRPGSIGKTDIYVVNINADGTYSEPQNLGDKVNTEGKEEFPFIGDDHILYFSSNGHSGMGGLDIFASKIFTNTISQPLNLGAPINSESDDFAFIISTKENKGYFSSNRDGGKGDDDIYSFITTSPLKIECTKLIRGVVKNKETQETLEGVTLSLLDENNSKIQQINTSANGTFTFNVACDKPYKIIGIKTYFEKGEEDVKATNDIDKSTIDLIVNLTPKEFVERKIVDIKPIFFDLNKWNIRSDAAKELDKVIKLMKDNPEIIVESRSHTDSRGKDAYNLSLSDKRAKSTVEYIISKGIEANRISGKGYGETKLLNKCSNGIKCSKAEHQENRRTEFFIVK